MADERVDTLDRGVTPIVYFAYAQTPNRSDSLVVRSAVEPAALTGQVRQAVAGIDPELPLYETRTMTRVIADSSPVFLRRYLAFLIGGFALLAAVLAAVGIYGVTAYSVEQRRHEIGVRMALGAAPRQVVRMVLHQGFSLAGLGVVLGLAGSVFATRALATLLFGVSGTDALVYLSVAAFLFGVVLLACGLPARRAVQVNPVVALRDE